LTFRLVSNVLAPVGREPLLGWMVSHGDVRPAVAAALAAALGGER
jgi:hypothetical protein